MNLNKRVKPRRRRGKTNQPRSAPFVYGGTSSGEANAADVWPSWFSRTVAILSLLLGCVLQEGVAHEPQWATHRSGTPFVTVDSSTQTSLQFAGGAWSAFATENSPNGQSISRWLGNDPIAGMLSAGPVLSPSGNPRHAWGGHVSGFTPFLYGGRWEMALFEARPTTNSSRLQTTTLSLAIEGSNGIYFPFCPILEPANPGLATYNGGIRNFSLIQKDGKFILFFEDHTADAHDPVAGTLFAIRSDSIFFHRPEIRTAAGWRVKSAADEWGIPVGYGFGASAAYWRSADEFVVASPLPPNKTLFRFFDSDLGPGSDEIVRTNDEAWVAGVHLAKDGLGELFAHPSRPDDALLIWTETVGDSVASATWRPVVHGMELNQGDPPDWSFATGFDYAKSTFEAFNPTWNFGHSDFSTIGPIGITSLQSNAQGTDKFLQLDLLKDEDLGVAKVRAPGAGVTELDLTFYIQVLNEPDANVLKIFRVAGVAANGNHEFEFAAQIENFDRDPVTGQRGPGNLVMFANAGSARGRIGDESWNVRFPIGEWAKVNVQMTLNDPGVANGKIVFRVDDQVIGSSEAVQIRNDASQLIDAVYLSAWPSSAGRDPDQPIVVRYDDLSIKGWLE